MFAMSQIKFVRRQTAFVKQQAEIFCEQCRLLANNRLLFVNEHRGCQRIVGVKNKRDEMMNYFHLLANNWRCL